MSYSKNLKSVHRKDLIKLNGLQDGHNSTSNDGSQSNRGPCMQCHSTRSADRWMSNISFFCTVQFRYFDVVCAFSNENEKIQLYII